jgi:hypothetical protein
MRPYRWLTLAAGVVLVAILVVPSFLRWKERTPPNGCLVNLHMLSFAMRMYAADGDGRLPLANRWVSCLVPSYISNDDVLKCPDDHRTGRCSYGMNAELSARTVASVGDDASAVLLYETGHPRDNPFAGPEDVAVPPRHEWGNNYCYLDGSVRAWRQPPSFSVR